MKITPELETVIEVKAEQEQKKHIQLNTRRRKIPGLTLYEYNLKTEELKEATYIQERTVNYLDVKPTNGTVKHTDVIKHKVLQSEECLYFQKLNRKNAVKHIENKYKLKVKP